MARLAVLSFSDGRERVHRDLVDGFTSAEGALTAALSEAGHDVLAREGIVHTSEGALAEARRIADCAPGPDDLRTTASGRSRTSRCSPRARRPARCCCSRTSTRSTPAWSACSPRPGRSTRSAASTGAPGATSRDPGVRRADRRARPAPAPRSAACAGSTFGRIGGRPMGMYTAVANADQWMRQFGVDVEEIDQWEIVRRCESVDARRASTPRASGWSARGRRPLRRRPADAGAARAPDPLLLRDARADRRVEARLLRHQGASPS